VRGSAILLVEHDMSLVMDLCDYVYVLDFGELIFEGAPDEVRMSPIVQTAYLGTTTTATPETAEATGALLALEADHG
jgi:ABC-type uncharacterized transport system ATPase subunit